MNNFYNFRESVQRSIRSLVDTFEFIFVRLSKKFYLWVLCLFGLSLVAILFPRNYSLLIAILAACLQWFRRRNGTGEINRYHFESDHAFIKEIGSILPSIKESEFDFKTITSSYAPDGPVTISESFNIDCISNPDWDCKIIIRKQKDRHTSIVSQLRRDAYFLKQYIFDKFINSFTKKCLINEKKIAFSSNFPPDACAVEVFQTDYFMSLCSSDLSVTNVVRYEDGKRILVSQARERAPFNKMDTGTHLIDFCDTAPPVSLHLGIEVIVISGDNYLRVAVQSSKTEFSQGMRAPLASGSMDWEDISLQDSLKDLIKKAAIRELTEEWGKKHPDLPDLIVKRIEPIGYFRMPHRGGKPQFVALAKITNPDANLRPDTSEVYADDSSDAKAIFKVNDISSLRQAVNIIIEENSNLRDSVPLYGAMLCLKTLIENRPKLINEVAGYQSALG